MSVSKNLTYLENHARTKGAGGEEMPTNLSLALITSSLQRIADHCKRYEVTGPKRPRVGGKFARPTLPCVQSKIATWTMRKCRICQDKLLNMLWLRSISIKKWGLWSRRGVGWPLLWARYAFLRGSARLCTLCPRFATIPSGSLIAWLQDIA